MRSPGRVLMASLALSAAVTLAGCSSSTDGGPPVTSTTVPSSQTSPSTSTSPTSSSPTSGSSLPSTSTPPVTPTSPLPSVAGERDITEGDNGHTVAVALGDVVVATLHNTYWRFEPPGPGLTQVGEETVTPAPRGTCLPGIGCGTVVARYRATGPGSSDLRASRSSCGEALPCGPGQGSWTVRVLVH